MATAEKAIRAVLDHEGGYVDHPDDRGGPTNRGITLRTLAAYWRFLGRAGTPDREDIHALTEAEATDIYRTLWWDRYGLGRIESDELACKALDLMALCGPTRGVQLLQRALGVDDDGILGPATLGAANQADARSALDALRHASSEYFRRIVERDPTQQVFLRGWLARAAR